MAIGIEKDGPFEVWKIPLVGLDEKFVPNWADNSWIILQLEHIVRKLKAENVSIQEFGMSVQHSSGCPELIIKVLPL